MYTFTSNQTMLRLLFTFIFSLANFYSFAQDYKFVYYLDTNLSSTNPTDAVIVAKGLPDEGNMRVDYFFKQSNIKLMSIHYTDSSLKTMDGRFISYYLNGTLENDGNYTGGVENGVWTKWDSAGRKTDSLYYEKGLLYVRTAYTYNTKGALNSYEYSDSLKDKYHYILYDSTGIKYDAVYSGNAGTLTSYDHGVATTKPILTKERIEAHFTGGDIAYRRYLQNNLDPNTPAEHGARDGTYRVMIRFKVEIDGRVSDVTAETNFGFGMEQEAIRIIKKSPPWVPAKLFGLPVVAYRRQPITFVVSGFEESGNLVIEQLKTVLC